jgi:hypothetical protein
LVGNGEASTAEGSSISWERTYPVECGKIGETASGEEALGRTKASVRALPVRAAKAGTSSFFMMATGGETGLGG